MADIAIRQALNDQGIGNERIGWDNNRKMVTVDGKDFMQGTTKNGTSYSNSNTFNQALNNFNGSGYSSIGPVGEPAVMDAGNPYDNQVNSLLNDLMNRINNPQSYDVYNSPEYQAAQQNVQRQADQSIRGAQESLGASGFARSTNLTDRTQRIQNDANEYMNTQIVPQLLSQNQSQQQQDYNNLFNILNSLQGQQGLYDTREQQTFENDVTMATLTGYLPDGTPTSAQQQQELANAWAQADSLGYITEDLADLIGIPAGTQTMAAKEYELSRQVQMGNLSNQQAQLALERDKNKNYQNQQALDNLYRQWEVTGVAPQGIPGVEVGTSFYQQEQTSSQTSTEVSKKDSTDNYYMATSEISKAETKAEAIQYAQSVRDYLTDSDYAKLLNYIEDNFFE